MADKVEKWLKDKGWKFDMSWDLLGLLRAALADPECNEALRGKAVDDLNEMFGMSQMLREGREERNRLEKLIYESQVAADCIVRQTHELPLAIEEWKRRALDAEAQLAAALRDKERLTKALKEAERNLEAGVGNTLRQWLTWRRDQRDDVVLNALLRVVEIDAAKARAAMSSSQPTAPADERWILLPNEQAWWWHWNGEDYAIPHIFHVRQSLTASGRYFIDFPDSRWCDAVGGFWMKIEYPNVPTRETQAKLVAKAQPPAQEKESQR